jgi:hypothetical protein
VLFALDALFLVTYTAFGLAYVAARWGRASTALLAALAIGLALAAGLDAIENFHILSMLHRVDGGALPSPRQIELQYVMSAVKFTIANLVAVCIALTYPTDTLLGRVVAVSTGLLFPVVGTASYAVSGDAASLLALIRTLLFVSGFGLSAIVFKGRSGHNQTAGG